MADFFYQRRRLATAVRPWRPVLEALKDRMLLSYDFTLIAGTGCPVSLAAGAQSVGGEGSNVNIKRACPLFFS
jgi:hypothetical protein